MVRHVYRQFSQQDRICHHMACDTDKTLPVRNTVRVKLANIHRSIAERSGINHHNIYSLIRANIKTVMYPINMYRKEQPITISSTTPEATTMAALVNVRGSDEHKQLKRFFNGDGVKALNDIQHNLDNDEVQFIKDNFNTLAFIHTRNDRLVAGARVLYLSEAINNDSNSYASPTSICATYPLVGVVQCNGDNNDDYYIMKYFAFNKFATLAEKHGDAVRYEDGVKFTYALSECNVYIRNNSEITVGGGNYDHIDETLEFIYKCILRTFIDTQQSDWEHIGQFYITDS